MLISDYIEQNKHFSKHLQTRNISLSKNLENTQIVA